MSITPMFGWDNSQAPVAVEEGLTGVSFWPRAAARIIDLGVHYLVSVFCGILFVMMLVVASGGHVAPLVLAKLRHTGVTGFVFSLLGIVAYHVVFTTVHGSTVGKIIFSMVVVQEDGSPCRLKGAIVRELGYFVDALFFGIIGYMSMKRTPQEQRYGDEWAHTMVCKRSKVLPENLRHAERFVIGLLFALIADAALIITSLLLLIAA